MLAGKLGADKMDGLDALLLETGAILAGGSILRAVSPWNANIRGLQGNGILVSPEVNDLDIYVPVRMTPRLIDGLYTGGTALLVSERYSVLPASSYCESFLRKNGIRRIHTFTDRWDQSPTDIMSVRHRRSVQQVVTNFDLTICQIWYDGAKVYASHPQDIRDKKATLQSDYVIALMRGNKFIRNRINKYMKRGFSISVEGATETFEFLPTDKNACSREQNQFEFRKTKPEFWNRWFASVATAWLSGSATTFRTKKSYLPSITDNMFPSKNMLLPLAQNFPYIFPIEATGLHLVTKGVYKFRTLLLDSFWNNYKDTGYDSEDYENVENRQALAANFMTTLIPDVAWQADGMRAFALAMNKFLEYQMLPIKYSNRLEDDRFRDFINKIRDGFTLGTFLYKSKDDIPEEDFDFYLRKIYMNPEVFNFYLGKLYGNVLRRADVATAYADADELVYDIHNHSLAAGISQAKFNEYLKNDRGASKNDIPCYWRECNKRLTFTEIHHILGRESYKKWFEDIPDEVPAQVLPMWKGFTQSDIQILDTIFSPESRSASSFSCCPVCLSYVYRGAGCIYMHHNCKNLNTDYSVDLYNKYLYRRTAAVNIQREEYDDNIWWCSICGRIASHVPQVHYALGDADGPKPATIEPLNANYSASSEDCRGFGGGGLLEKFIRFQKLREVANLLQSQVGKITAKEAKEYLIKEVWNAPVNISPTKKQVLQSLLESKKYNIPSTVFPASLENTRNTGNNIVYPNIPYPNGAGADPLLPILHPEGDDAQSYETVRPAIQFVHRRKNGEVNLHQDEYIGLKNYFNLLQSRNDEYTQGRGGDIGICWNFPDCDARIHPQEVQAILTRLDTNAADYPEITAEDKARYQEIYNKYKNLFNKRFQEQQGGAWTRKGRRKQHGGDDEAKPFFVEATNTQCTVPPRSNATVPAARKRTTLKRKTLRRRRRRATRHR
jgi:hypothetical protein